MLNLCGKLISAASAGLGNPLEERCDGQMEAEQNKAPEGVRLGFIVSPGIDINY